MLEYDNAAVFEFFLSLQRYWLQGFSGITGLDHSGVIARIAMFKASRSDRQWLLQGIEALEDGVLQAWADKRAAADDKNPLTATQRQQIKERKAWRF